MLPEAHLLEGTLSDELGLDLRVAVARRPLAPEGLTRKERQTYTSLCDTPRARSWLLGRAALKSLRADVDGCADTGELMFPNARFSLTHSRDVAVAVTETSRTLDGIGIDLELDGHIQPAAARFFLTQREQKWLLGLARGQWGRQLLRMWCIKEAVFKANPENTDKLLSDHELTSPWTTRGEARASSGKRIDYATWSVAGTCLALAVCR